MIPKKLMEDYLSFSKKDRIGLAVAVVLVLFFYFVPLFLSRGVQPLSIREAEFLALTADSIAPATPSSGDQHKPAAAAASFPSRASRLFSFDPNRLDIAGWQQLGLSERVAATIIKYRSKGGRFRKKEDLARIWGLPPGFYDRVKNYIRIEEEPAEFHVEEHHRSPASVERKIRILDVNEADSAAFESLPGIGGKLAIRIIAFREKLGGFYSADQLSETWGLNDTVYQRIRPYLKVSGTVKKVRINLAGKEEMAAHPYIRWKLAAALIAYRTQHGPFRGPEDLKALPLLDEKGMQKLLPYLEF